MKGRWWVWFLAILPMLGWHTTGLFDLDEGFYGAVVAEMNRRGEWITPYYNGSPWFEKPILLYWLAKPSVALLGFDWGCRLPSVLCTIAMYVLVWRFTRRHLSERAADLCVSVLGSALLVVVLGRLMMTDAALCLCLTGAFLTFWESLQNPSKKIWTGLWLGLAVLAKGPVALILFGLVLLVFLATHRDHLSRLKGAWIPAFAILFAVIASWYVPAYLANGQVFVQKFLIEQNIGRFTGGDAAHSLGLAGLPFYIPILFLGLLPLSPSLWSAWIRRPGNMRSPVLDYLSIWAGTIFVFFTISSAKLPHYILPIFPPLAILLAQHFEVRGKTPKAHLLTGLFSIAWTILLFVFGPQYYRESGQAAAHQTIARVPKDTPLVLYQLSRREKSLGTGSAKVQETSLPSLIMYRDSVVTDTETVDDFIKLPRAFVFTRIKRFSPEDVKVLERQGTFRRTISGAFFEVWEWRKAP